MNKSVGSMQQAFNVNQKYNSNGNNDLTDEKKDVTKSVTINKTVTHKL